MHTPTKTQWQKAIDNLKKVLPQAILEGHFNMKECTVHRKDTLHVIPHECGTVHCIGGWYALAVCKLDLSLQFIGFTIGTEQMAKDLGFQHPYDLTQWAEAHPVIWGNGYGHAMFGDEIAYDNAKTLAEAITYLEGVRDRSPD